MAFNVTGQPRWSFPRASPRTVCALPTARRPSLRRGDALSRRTMLRGPDGLDEAPPARVGGLTERDCARPRACATRATPLRVLHIHLGRCSGRWSGQARRTLAIEQRFGSHKDAANWYPTRGYDLPRNCMVPETSLGLTTGQTKKPPSKVKASLKTEIDPSRAVRL
jgi:hypothetical protein